MDLDFERCGEVWEWGDDFSVMCAEGDFMA